MSKFKSPRMLTTVTRRRALGAAALATGMVLIAGCSASSATGPTGSPSALSGTVTVWDPFYDVSTPSGMAMKKVDDAFVAANPGVTVKHELKGWDVIFTQLQAAVTTQKGPDAFLMYGGSFAKDYQRGLLPLDEKFNSDLQLKGKLKFVDLNKTNGSLLALPVGTFTTRIQYNKALFTKAGLDPENPPTTWDGLLQACSKLKSIGTIPIAAGFKDGFYGEWMTYATTPQTLTSDQVIKGTNGDLSYTDTPGIRSAYQPLIDLYKANCYSPNSEALPSAPDPLNQFDGGKAAIVFATDSSMEQTAKAIGAQNLGIMRMPILPSSLHADQTFDASSNWSFAVGKWSSNANAAYAYLSYMASSTGQQTLFDTAGLLPNVSGVTLKSDLPAQATLLGWLGSTPEPRLLLGFGATTEAVFDKRISQVVTGSFSLDDMLKELEDARLKSIR